MKILFFVLLLGGCSLKSDPGKISIRAEGVEVVSRGSVEATLSVPECLIVDPEGKKKKIEVSSTPAETGAIPGIIGAVITIGGAVLRALY
jgi:hypothetical protein